jgi:hypothetical protein
MGRGQPVSLGSRPLDLLIVIIERHGKMVVSKPG